MSSADLPIHVRPGVPHSVTGSSSSTSFGSRRDSSPNAVADPLGLQIVYSQAGDTAGDIVFVHGLGGSAWKTWSCSRDAASFWPLWLAEDDLLSAFRVSTFGYNAKFKSSASNNLDILDFAKDLLFQLMTVLNTNGEHGRPIIFVAHSMGGLVVKQAYMLGKHDKEYSDVISNVRGMLFLATPHRGSQYAKILNNILSAIGTSQKAYVAGLGRQSGSLQNINELFRKQCDDLLLFSFYETLKTSLSLTRVLVVEKDSAILGYPNEESLDMNADHHSICKYKDPLDPNYNKVKGVLATWARKFQLEIAEPAPQEKAEFDPANHVNHDRRIEDILGVTNHADDLVTRQLDTPRPGDWLFKKHDFRNWVQGGTSDSTSQHFLLTGLPGTGKSVLSQSVIEYLKSLNHEVHYHFFDRTHQLKKTAVYCVRLLAFQLASCHDEFRDAVLEMHARTGTSFNSQSFQWTWEQLFEGILFQLDLQRPLFLVIDGIDESDASTILMSRIASIQSKTPVRVFLTGKPLKVVPTKESFATYSLQCSDTTSDMRGYVTKAVEGALPGDKALQNFVRTEVLEKASGSFLWTRLALEILQDSWHTKGVIVSALTKVPWGMTAMYDRMVEAIEEQGPRNRQLARQVLALVACSWRPLFVDELADALKREFGVFTNLELTITQICGHFVTVQQTESGRKSASLIHATAREFLLQANNDNTPWIDADQAHGKMAQTCLMHLSDERWRRDLGSLGAESSTDEHHASRLQAVYKDHPLFQYATYHWAFHLSKSPLGRCEILETLEEFLLTHCLTWIEAIALSRNMIHLIRSARYLKAYVKKSSREFRDDTRWIKDWPTDFLRIASKFASNLVQSPSSVHRNVPPMCPRASMIGKIFGSVRKGSLSVSGFPSETWDECLASVLIDNDAPAAQVLANESQFFILAQMPGIVTVWSAETFEKTRALEHGEWVFKMAISQAGARLATTGSSNSYVWDTASGSLLHRIPKSYDAVVHNLAFGRGEAGVLIAYDNFVLESVDLRSGRLSQTAVNLSHLEIGYQRCPAIQAISPDLTKVAMSWRGLPPLVWDLRSGQDSLPLKCRTRGPTDSLLNPKQLHWHPETGSLLILCADTKLFEWQVFIDDLLEYPHVQADKMVISSDGNLLLSSDHYGTLRVWTFPKLKNLIYKLTDRSDPVVDFAFSSDNQRIYDIRGSGCNVWEPDALVRLDDHETEETSSATGSTAMTEQIPSPMARSNDTITAMVIGPDDKYFACGRADGSVIIHDAFEGRRVRRVLKHQDDTAVVMISWSKSGKYLASCDDSAFVVVKKLQIKEDGKFAVFGMMEKRLEEPVRQLVFSPDERMLLISTLHTDRALDLNGKTEVYAISRASQYHSRYWVGHPQAPNRLLWLEENMAKAYEWATGSSMNDPQSGEVSVAEGQVETSPDCRCRSILWSSPVDGGRHQVLAVSEGRHNFHGTAEIQLVCLEAEGTAETAAPWRKLSLNIDGEVKLFLGTVDNHLIFLGCDGWVCSYDVTWRLPHEGLAYAPRTEPAVRRHFYLPKDWLNTTTSRMAAVNSEGTLFCPKLGDVAIVRNGLRF